MLRGSLLIHVNQIPGAPMCSLILDIVTATGGPLEFLSLVASRYGTDVLATIMEVSAPSGGKFNSSIIIDTFVASNDSLFWKRRILAFHDRITILPASRATIFI